MKLIFLIIISDGFISGIPLGTDVSNFNLDIWYIYDVKLTDSKDNLKSSGVIATGDNVSIYLDDVL